MSSDTAHPPDGRIHIGEPDPQHRHRHLQPVIDALRSSGNETSRSWWQDSHGPDCHYVFRYPLDLGLLHRTFLFPDFIYVGPDKTSRPVVECSRTHSMIWGMGGPYGPAPDPLRGMRDLLGLLRRRRRPLAVTVDPSVASDGRIVIGEPVPEDPHRHLQPVIDVLLTSGNERSSLWHDDIHGGGSSFRFRRPLDLDLLHRTFVFPDFIYVGPSKTGRPMVACSRTDSVISGGGTP